MKKLFPVLFAVLVSAASYANVYVTSPTAGATVGSPTHFTAYALSNYPITAMRIYVDNVSVYAANSSTIDTYVSMSAGSHYVVVQAWDSAGQIQKTPLTISVGGSSGTTPAPAPAPAPAPPPSSTTTGGSTGGTTTGTLISNIDQMGGWASCTTCAGAGGNGPSASFSMGQGVSSPSIDGSAAVFSIGGSTAYSDALWWKQLGAQSGATHFVYGLYFYYKNSSAPQALEFDVNQSVGGIKYIFGTQCDIRGSGQWDVWNGATKHWVPTGIACPAPPTYTWNHLILEFQRGGGQATFVSVTLNGVKHYINLTYSQIPSGVNELNVAFQMDGNYAQTPYSVYLDKVSLRYW